MFDRFSDHARRTMARARKASLDWRHGVIDVEHILLGLLDLIGDTDTSAGKVLSQLGVERDGLRTACESTMVPGDVAAVGQIPFTPSAKNALEAALREADRRGDRHIGTEHILLGVFQCSSGSVAAFMASLGLTLDAVRAAVAAVVDE